MFASLFTTITPSVNPSALSFGGFTGTFPVSFGLFQYIYDVADVHRFITRDTRSCKSKRRDLGGRRRRGTVRQHHRPDQASTRSELSPCPSANPGVGHRRRLLAQHSPQSVRHTTPISQCGDVCGDFQGQQLWGLLTMTSIGAPAAFCIVFVYGSLMLMG